MRQVSINVYAQTFMTNFLLPRLLARENRSAIIDVSSVIIYFTSVSLPMYCATKNFNFSLSKCIADAYRDKIDVLCVTPHSVKSQMNSGRYLYSLSAERHGKAVIDKLGWTEVTRGPLLHAL